MFKKPFFEDAMIFVIERTNQMQEQMTMLYNRLHHTAYIPKNNLLRPRLDNSRTYNEMYLELNTIFREVKSANLSKKYKKKITEAERTIGMLELSFLKIKNIKISSIDSIGKEHSLNQLILNRDINDNIMTAYLSMHSEQFIKEVKTVSNREDIYPKVITSFLKDTEYHTFILDELQIEITKHLAILSNQLNNTLNEEEFWNSVSSSIAKHYIIPVFLEELIRK